MTINANGMEEKFIVCVDAIMLLRMVPTNSKVFLRSCMDLQEKLISTSAIKIQKENWG